MKKKRNTREPIRLREKALNDGGSSLYLDIYIDGKRSYEFLKLYLVKERTKEDRARNEQTMRLAEAVKSQRVVELQNGRFGFEQKSEKVLFFDYLDAVANSKGGKTLITWRGLANHLRQYTKKENLRLCDITKDFVVGFADFLGGLDIKPSTQKLYLDKLKCCLNSAVKDELIPKSPAQGITIRANQAKREFLTIDEIRLLANDKKFSPCVKRKFLFSCLTGLRWSDLTNLTWDDVQELDGRTRIVFRQQKTKQQEYLDISDEAVKFLPPRGSGEVFGIHSACYANSVIKQACERCGIKKHISFHCARHSFAVLMLDLGVDIYTVSKLLGHTDVKTTQIYAKVLDKNKQAAVDKIPRVL